MKSIIDLFVARWALFYLGASILILGTAYIFQHGFGYQPCELCYLQRYPYMIAIPVALVAFLTRNRTDIGTKRAARGFLIILIFLMFLDAFIAGHHIGVEMGYWQAYTSCVGPEIDPNVTVEDFINSLSAVSIPCDQPQWTLFGISMAGYNFMLALGLGLFGVYTYRRTA